LSRLGSGERVKRILELRQYAKENFTAILHGAEREIAELGWVPADDDPTIRPDTINQPGVSRRGTKYRRPWGDFLLILWDIAQKRWLVTDATAKAYAKAALQPLEDELLTRKWKGRDGSPWHKRTPSR
jgi:hypothetical protein